VEAVLMVVFNVTERLASQRPGTKATFWRV
jgi:hypothetical protein